MIELASISQSSRLAASHELIRMNCGLVEVAAARSPVDCSGR
jgi:hypothetical protein